jgi:transcriptional regulator with XRE-family HTH domain
MKNIPACGRFTGEIDLLVGARMRARRKQVDMSQAALARTVRVSGQRLRSYEAGEARPEPAELGAIATALAVSISYFFDRDCDPQAS